MDVVPLSQSKPLYFCMDSVNIKRQFPKRYLWLIALLCGVSFASEIQLVDESFRQPNYQNLDSTRGNTNSKIISPTPNGYLARIELDAPNDLKNALKRAENLYLGGKVEKTGKPLTFVLHGPEVALFFKDNYQQNKEIVDIVARLTAFKVVEIQVCETRMGVLGRDKSELVPFVGTVPFGPAEIDRLLKQEKYIYF